MEASSSLADIVVNVIVSFLIVVIALFIVIRRIRGKGSDTLHSSAEDAEATNTAVSSVNQPFVNGAFLLWIIRSIGFGCIYIYLKFGHGCARREIDPRLLVMVDCFTMFSLWTWFSVLRGSKYPGFWRTFVEICSAIMVIVPIDLALSVRHSSWALFPSGLLNEMSFGFAVGACAFRYKKNSIPLIVAYTMYNWLQLPAYKDALLCDPGAAGWGVYYVLAAGKGVNFLLICDLLLNGVQEQKPLELLHLLRKPLGYVGAGPIVALIALIFALKDRWEWLKNVSLNSLAVSVSILVPVVAVLLAFWEKLGNSKRAEESASGQTISLTLLQLTEGEYEELRSKAKQEGISTQELIRKRLKR